MSQLILSSASDLEAALSSAASESSGEVAAALSNWRRTMRSMRRSYEDALSAQPGDGSPPRKIDQGAFRLLFTFEERAAETAFESACRAAANAGEASEDQLTYLTMRQDYEAASYIDLDEDAVGAAMDFYVAFGLLNEDRAAEVLAGYRPGEMPEPEPDPEPDPEE